MKKTIIISAIYILYSIALQAQVYVGANVGINNTKLYNTSDAKADERQDYIMTWKPQFGFELGYAIKNKLSIGILPQLYKAGQNYKGVPLGFSDISSIAAQVNLNYLKLPIYGRLHFNNANSKISSFLQLGLAPSFLSNFTEVNTYNYIPSGLNQFRTQQVTTFNRHDAVGIETKLVNGISKTDTSKIGFDKGFYKSTAFSIQLGYGINLQVSKQLNIYAQLQGEYGLSNIEQTDTLYFLDPITRKPNGDYYMTKQFKYTKYNTAPNSTEPDRSTYTNHLAVGLQVGVIYRLNPPKQIVTNR